MSANQMSEEELEELYENILNLIQAKKHELESKLEELELELEETKITLENKESELFDSQISGTQTSASQGDEEKEKSNQIT